MELEKILEKADKLKEGINDKWNQIKSLSKYKGMTDDQIMMKAAAAGEIKPEEIDKLALNNIRLADLQKAKQAAQQNKESKTPENQGNDQTTEGENHAENSEQPPEGTNQNQEGGEQSADNGNGLPEFFKDFEGKAQVSPDDIKAVLSDPTKGQQLIDWVKTQNKIVKEVPGLQNVMKQAQSQPKNNGTEGEADKSTTDNGKLRPFQDYLEPLGKIMKTQADCDQAIQFFTNLKNTKPAAPANNGTETVQNNTQTAESSSKQAK